ncbi:zinc finger protein 367-like [Bufo gargarizans]|uniref:zinc finger protein 367-like n=1 Tax=Bufo gargarizans TaxID=30331 RepID=UPI001CF52AE7|nr:zinc finger protein 367-like [Bufo gargarizans]
MPRSKEISEEVRKKVVEAHKDGKGYKAISKVFDLHRSTVRQIIYKWKVFNSIDTRPRSGRPTKLDTILRRVMRSGAGKASHPRSPRPGGADDGEQAAHMSENRRIGKDGSGSAEEGESARVPGADTSPGSGVEDDVGAPMDPLRPSDAAVTRTSRIRNHKVKREEAERARSRTPGSPPPGSSRRAPRPAEHHVEVILCCEICGSCFPTETDLEAHQAEHLEETLHQCEECGKAFQSAGGLKTHKKRKHGC